MGKQIPENDPMAFDSLSPEKKEAVLDWIRYNLYDRETFNPDITSYGLKHIYEQVPGSTDRYLTNGQFKGAMLACGFRAKNTNEINWVFNISARSPAFRRKTTR